MLLISLWFVAALGFADPTGYKYSPAAQPVFGGPGDAFPKIFTLARRERVFVAEIKGDFARIRFKRNGRVVAGYVPLEALREALEPPPLPEEGWAVGVTGLYARLSQNGKTFQTADEVKYTTSKYDSTTISPFLFLQFRRHDFYRLFLGLRTIHMKGKATTDVKGSDVHEVDLHQSAIAFGLDRAWNPFTFAPPLYLGFGFEGARASSMKVMLDDIELPMSSENLPFYMGLHGLAGAEFFLNKTLSVAIEGRLGSYLNQAVPVVRFEAAGTIYFWL